MGFDNRLVLLFSPPFLLDVRVQVVMPSLAALLTDSTGQMLGDVGPVLGTVLLDESHDEVILFFGLGYRSVTQGPLMSLGLRTFCHR